jgi:hypothetical protein
MTKRMTDAEITQLCVHTKQLEQTYTAELDELIASLIMGNPSIQQTHELCLPRFPDISKPPMVIVRKRASV